MVAEQDDLSFLSSIRCSLAKISMVAELKGNFGHDRTSCSLAKISMVAERPSKITTREISCSLAKISMVAELLA